jgi:hypothetical protein
VSSHCAQRPSDSVVPWAPSLPVGPGFKPLRGFVRRRSSHIRLKRAGVTLSAAAAGRSRRALRLDVGAAHAHLRAWRFARCEDALGCLVACGRCSPRHCAVALRQCAVALWQCVVALWVVSLQHAGFLLGCRVRIHWLLLERRGGLFPPRPAPTQALFPLRPCVHPLSAEACVAHRHACWISPSGRAELLSSTG